MPLLASQMLPEPKEVEVNVLKVDKALLGKTFKQEQKKVVAALEALSEDEDETVSTSRSRGRTCMHACLSPTSHQGVDHATLIHPSIHESPQLCNKQKLQAFQAELASKGQAELEGCVVTKDMCVGV